MKTQTAEEFVRPFIKDVTETQLQLMESYTTTQIEALRERLKEATLPMTINDEPTNLVTMTKGSIDQVINNFLKELTNGKR